LILVREKQERGHSFTDVELANKVKRPLEKVRGYIESFVRLKLIELKLPGEN